MLQVYSDIVTVCVCQEKKLSDLAKYTSVELELHMLLCCGRTTAVCVCVCVCVKQNREYYAGRVHGLTSELPSL